MMSTVSWAEGQRAQVAPAGTSLQSSLLETFGSASFPVLAQEKILSWWRENVEEKFPFYKASRGISGA